MKKKKGDGTTNWSHKHDFPIDEGWNTKNTLARLIASRLVTFRDLDKHGHPDGFKDIREWNAAIQKMIDAFELMKYAHCLSEEDDLVVDEGIALFCKYFRNLWD